MKAPIACSFTLLIAGVLLAGSANGGILYGTSGFGQLFRINVATGAGTLLGSMPEATEIEYDPLSGRAWTQYPDGAFTIQQFNINTGATIGAVIPDAGSYTGLEFVGSTLYGTVITASGGPSSLRILNSSTGTSSLVGATGVGPISGLAYNGTMYGIAGGSGPANLYTISLVTGLATLVGSTGIQAGSLEFGPDGNLYAGTTGANGGRLYRINPLTGTSILVGLTGFSSVTGLALDPVPEPGTILLLAVGLATLLALASAARKGKTN
jgi:PEP-CTERM motif